MVSVRAGARRARRGGCSCRATPTRSSASTRGREAAQVGPARFGALAHRADGVNERMGATWLLLVAPDKESVYPELLPRSVRPFVRRRFTTSWTWRAPCSRRRLPAGRSAHGESDGRALLENRHPLERPRRVCRIQTRVQRARPTRRPRSGVRRGRRCRRRKLSGRFGRRSGVEAAQRPPPRIEADAPPPPHPRLDGLDRHAGARRRRALARASSRSSACRPSPPRDALVAQARELGVARIALADADAAARAAEAWTDGEVLAGAEGLVRLVVESRPTSSSTRSSARPASGPTVAALGEGIDLALANKESLVVGGELVTQLAEATGAQIIPVDSEHSAIHQLLAGEQRRDGRPARPDRLRRPVPRPQRAPSCAT